MNRFKKLSIPYLIWMILLVLIPIVLLIVMAFQDTKGVKIFEAKMSFNNFKALMTTDVGKALGLSMIYASVTTVCCLLIAYPVAYIIARANFKNRFLVLTLLILPMWSNTLLRTKAIASLFMEGNIITTMFEKIGITIHGLNLYQTPIGVIIGMVAMYLPFMILPIYTVLEKIDKSLYDASDDLGANSFKTFWKVTFPISLKGVTTGIILVFLPCATGFGVAEGLGEYRLIGSYIEQQFRNGATYGMGSLVAIIILVVITASLFIVGKVDKEGETLL